MDEMRSRSTTNGPSAGSRNDRFARIMAIVGGLFFVVAGLWAMASPRSFFDSVAEFPPYNQHLLQDIGAFQIGLGAVLLVALLVRRVDALATALLGVGIGSLAHTVSHVIGRDLGGNPASDITLSALLTVALLAAGWSRARPSDAAGR